MNIYKNMKKMSNLKKIFLNYIYLKHNYIQWKIQI